MYWTHLFRNYKKNQRWDWHLVIYAINVFLVVYGYGLRGDSFQMVKNIRTVLVVVSLAGLFLLPKSQNYVFDSKKNWVIWTLLGLITLTIPFSINMVRGFERLAAWVPFMIYVNYFVVYLFRQYQKEEAKIKLLQLFSLVYFYPVALMFVRGVVFQTENIYGQAIDMYRANVLGWACAFFLLTSFDLLSNLPTSRRFRFIFYVIALFTLWGIVLTGSRSSYLSLAAGILILVVRNNRTPLYFKALSVICISAFAYYIITSPDSVVNLRSQYAEIRQQRGEIRFQLAEQAISTFWKHPQLFITGYGFDNFREGLFYFANIRTELAPHNSYLELLFSCGVFVFLFFLAFVVFPAFVKYIRFDSQYYVFFPMLAIVPYFESNLNAGQFLFFPWMTFLFYYVHISSQQIASYNTVNPSPKTLEKA
ncbi:MAG: O-antigen ligase family protein [Runella sp.]